MQFLILELNRRSSNSFSKNTKLMMSNFRISLNTVVSETVGPVTWSLLEVMAPGFFFFLSGLEEVSDGECPLDEWVGLDTLLFCGATARSADPGGSGATYRMHKQVIIHARVCMGLKDWVSNKPELYFFETSQSTQNGDNIPEHPTVPGR